MVITLPNYEEHLSYYMRMNEDKLIEKYYEKKKKLNKRLGRTSINSYWAIQEIYEIEQALKKKKHFQ